MKRVISLLLLAVLATNMAACGSGEVHSDPAADTDVQTAETVTAEDPNAIPESPVAAKDYGGRELRVITNINNGNSWALNEGDIHIASGFAAGKDAYEAALRTSIAPLID